MKHCAKKLLGLAFALALCLAVGGTALAETPESADVPAALPEQEMLAFEPYAAPAAGEKTIDRFATDGYTVTIPTTVTFNSGENKKDLTVKAKLKQYRTLNIGIESTNNWKLKYQGAAEGTTTPEVDYILSENDDGEMLGSHYWRYIKTAGSTKDLLVFAVAQPSAGTTGADALNWHQDISAKLPITVPTPSQATMSGTYSDTLTFTFNLDKQCVTYTINVYEQKLERTNTGTHITAVNVVDASGNVTDTTSVPKETYVLEYGCEDVWGAPLSTAVDSYRWTRPRPESDNGEDERCWEALSRTLTPKADFNANNKTQTINLNLVRKWCWLDVNGITNKGSCADCGKSGNQGSSIGSFVNIRVSADDGATWSDWFWYSKGDDYWGTFPYGTEFQLGLHRVKDGYAYDEDADGKVAIYANGVLTNTQSKDTSPDGRTRYRVYKGKLTGEPFDTALYNTTGGGNVHEGAGSKDLPRYCYNPCYVNGITYYANDDDCGGGREDTNNYHGAHTSFKYTDGMPLADPMDKDTGCAFTAPEGKVFAGWSTTKDYTAGQTLYAANVDESSVDWLDKTNESNHDTLPTGDGQTKCRVLYAIWGYKTDIKIAFENKFGSTDKNASGVFETVQKRGFEYEQTLKTDMVVIPGQTLTLKMDDANVTAAIDTATNAVGGGATKEKIWDLEKEYTITVPENKATMPRFEILRKRYLLNVMAVLSTTGGVTFKPLASIDEAEQYGKFHVKSNGSYQTKGDVNKVSVYQWLRNYGGSYEVCEVEANPGYKFTGFIVTSASGHPTTAGDGKTITDTLTGKNSGIGYFDGDSTTYDGDTIYVVFKKDTVTFDFNGGKNQENETQTEVQYVPGSYIPQMSLQRTGTSSFKGWSVNETETPGETIYYPNITQLKDIQWKDSENKVLYARWSNSTVSCNIKIQFENEKGYTDSSATVHEGGSMDDATHTYSVTLENQNVVPGGSWTLDLSDPAVPAKVKKAIEDATTEAKSAANDTDTTTADNMFKYKVWKLAEKFVKQGDCSIKVPSSVTDGQTLTLKIKRRRYLLSVLSTDADTGRIADLVTKDEEKYGTFNVTVNGTKEAEKKSFYQCGWNYGASYTVSNVSAVKEFNSMDMLILKSLAEGDNVTAYASNLKVNLKGTAPSYSSYVTEKQKEIHYYRTDGTILQDSGGDPVRVIFYNTTATAKPRPSLAPAKKALTLRYHANFDPNEELDLDLDPNPLLDDMDDTFGFDPDPLPEDVDDVLEGAVKIVSYQPGEDVVLRNCMFKRGGYVFVGWNTEPDGTGKGYEVNGVPITDWAAGDTVDLYAQWKKPGHLKPVVDDEPFVPADPDTPPEWVDDVFGVDPAQPEGLDDAFGVDPAAQPDALDDAFGVDPDPLPDELDDAFSV